MVHGTIHAWSNVGEKITSHRKTQTIYPTSNKSKIIEHIKTRLVAWFVEIEWRFGWKLAGKNE